MISFLYSIQTEKGFDNSDTLSGELKDIEGEQVKVKYPRSIVFIISNEFCERFNYYGMRSEYGFHLFSKQESNESF